MIDMQKILKFTVVVFLFTLFSCETIVPVEYKLYARTPQQELELNKLIDEEGIYKESMDSSLHILSFKYSKRLNDLSKLNLFLKQNNLLNSDTVYSDSAYLLIDQLVSELDSLDPEDDIVKEEIIEIENVIEEVEEIEKDTTVIIAPVLEMPSVTQ